jgi:murein L,D-transpeptidase YcbB/YkuD
MPVILFYTTAVARSNELAFFEDIYGHDRRLDEALRSGPTPP